MKAQMLRLFVYSAPAKIAVMIPDAKLGGEKCPAKNPTAPPNSVDNIPMYGPRIIPIMGAVIAAKVMALLGKPTIGKAGMKEEIVYNAAKHVSKPTSFDFSLLVLCICTTLLHSALVLELVEYVHLFVLAV